MKKYYTDLRFEYKGFGIHDSFCEVVIFEHDNKFLAILTEPCTENSGTSVTNACEDITTKLFNQLGVFPKGTKPDDIMWVEHYPERGFPETFDIIKLEYKDRRFGSPKWLHIGETLIEEKMWELLNVAQ